MTCLSRSILLFLSLSVTTITYAEESMKKSDVLQHFENLYNAIKPAQESSQEAFAWFSTISHPLFNAIIHLRCADVGRKVDIILQQAPPDAPISFWVHPENRANGLIDILKERGFQPVITCPLMSWKINPISPPKFDIRPVTPANKETFYDIISTVYQLNEEVKIEFQKLIETCDCEDYILYIDGSPASTGTLMVNGPIGGIFNDATLPERREASTAMMQYLMHRSAELNLQHLILLSSPEGEELYQELGFDTAFNIDIYCRDSVI